MFAALFNTNSGAVRRPLKTSGFRVDRVEKLLKKNARRKRDSAPHVPKNEQAAPRCPQTKGHPQISLKAPEIFSDRRDHQNIHG